MKHELATERFLFSNPPLSWRYVPTGVVYWKELEKSLPRHGNRLPNFYGYQFKATITDHLVHYHGRHRTEFKDLPLVAIDTVGDHRNVGILYGCIDEAGK